MKNIKGFIITVSNKHYKDQLGFGNEYTEFYPDTEMAKNRVEELQECAEKDDTFGIKNATLTIEGD